MDFAAVWNAIRPYTLRTLLAVLILVIGLLVARLARLSIMRAIRRKCAEETAGRFASNFIHITLITVAIAAALAEMGVQTTSIIAIIGTVGIAIGLALQSSLANLASGIILVILKPFTVGDFIEGAGQSGTVAEVGLFATTLKAIDGKKVVVPNAKLTDGCIVNYSTHPTRRLDASVTVSYSADLEKVKSTLLGVIAAEPMILRVPEPIVAVNELGDNGVEIGIKVWANSQDYWPLRFKILGSVKAAFDAAGIEIPFPQRVVHISRQA